MISEKVWKKLSTKIFFSFVISFARISNILIPLKGDLLYCILRNLTCFLVNCKAIYKVCSESLTRKDKCKSGATWTWTDYFFLSRSRVGLSCLPVIICSWERSPLNAQAYIGLSPVLDNFDFRLQGSQSDIISNIGLTSLASSIFDKFVGISVHIPPYTLAKKVHLFLVVRMVPVYYYEY